MENEEKGITHSITASLLLHGLSIKWLFFKLTFHCYEKLGVPPSLTTSSQSVILSCPVCPPHPV